MSFSRIFFRCWFSLLLLPFANYAQSELADSMLQKQGVAYAVSLHDSAVKDQLALYNGSLYAGYPYPFSEGTPYFAPGVFSRGDLWYDKQYFGHILLLYDNHIDQVILNLGIDLQLVSDKIDSFYIGSRKIIRLTSGAGLEITGFYELLATGNTQLYSRQKKKINEIASPYEGLLHSVQTSDHYYLKKDGHFITISGRNDLLDALTDQKIALRQYIKKNRIAFKNNLDAALSAIVSYYNQLSKQ